MIFDAQAQARIDNSDLPSVDRLTTLFNQVPRAQLAPYETTKPVTGGQFFGRRSDINKVLQHPQTNYLFVGIRRIGKTSLLKEIQRRMDRIDPPGNDQIPAVSTLIVQ